MRGVLAVLATAVAAAGCGGSDAPAAGDVTSSPAGPARVTQLDAGAVGVADVAGESWFAQPETGTVQPGDAAPIAVGEAPLRIVDTPTGVWVSVIRDGTVVRIDPAARAVDRTVRLEPAGSEPEGLAWDGEHLWVVDQAHDRVVELDGDGSVVASFRTGGEPRLAAAGDAAVWVTGFGASSLTRVADGRARTVRLTGCTGPQGVAETAGRVWVACTTSGNLLALDATTMRPVAEVDDLPDADAVVADDGTVYVVGQSGPTVYVVDAADARLRDSVALDRAHGTTENVGAAIVGNDLVVTLPDLRRSYAWPLS